MLCFITVLVVTLRCVSSNLPPHFPKCDLNDPELDNCILSAAEELRPAIRKGIEDVKIPSFDPLFASFFRLVQDSKLLNFTATLVNCTIQGLDNYNFQEIKYNPQTMNFNGSVIFDSVIFECDAEVNARLLTIPVEGKGFAKAGLVAAKANFEVNGEMKKSGNIDYYHPTGTKVRGTIEDAHYDFTGLFQGHEELGRVTNNMLNENSKVIIQAATPTFEALAEQSLMRMMKSFTKSLPYYELFSQSDKSR